MKLETTLTIIAITVAIVVTASIVSKVAYAWDPWGSSDGHSASPVSPGSKGTGDPPGQIIGPEEPKKDAAPGHVKAAPK